MVAQLQNSNSDAIGNDTWVVLKTRETFFMVDLSITPTYPASRIGLHRFGKKLQPKDRPWANRVAVYPASQLSAKANARLVGAAGAYYPGH
jgi:hypothetical protein